MLCTTSETFRILAYSELYSFRYIQAYSRISALLKHIQAYSTSFLTLAYSQPYHIPSLGILEPKPYSKACETLTRHIQSPAIVRAIITVYSGIIPLTHIQAYSEPCVLLTYAKIWHIWNPEIFRTLPKFCPDAYSEIVIFTKIGKPYVTL